MYTIPIILYTLPGILFTRPFQKGPLCGKFVGSGAFSDHMNIREAFKKTIESLTAIKPTPPLIFDRRRFFLGGGSVFFIDEVVE